MVILQHSKLYKIALVFITIFLSIVIISIIGILHKSYAQSIDLTPSTLNVKTNDEFDIKILISTNGSNLVGADVIINYNNSNLQVVSITQGTIFSTYPQHTSTTTQISISGLDATYATPYNGNNGVFATVRLRALSTTDTANDLQIAYSSGSTTDSNLTEQTTTTDLLSSVSNSHINIASTSSSGSGTLPNTGISNISQIFFYLFGLSLIVTGMYWTKESLYIAKQKIHKLTLKGFITNDE